MFKSLAAAALLGMVSTHRLAVSDVSDVLGRILPITTIIENGKIQVKLTENNRFISNNQYFLNIKGNNTNTTLKFRFD